MPISPLRSPLAAIIFQTMKTKFNNWLKQNKTNITRPEKYSNTITTVSNHFKKTLNKKVNLYEITSPEELLLVKEDYFSFDDFYKKNETGNRMYSRSIDLYIEFLESNRLEIYKTISEIDEINKNYELTETEKESIILSRIGQGKYRNDVINLWECCAISGFGDSRLLIASHIKPWKKSNNIERIDKYNGLLLLPTFDKLFDLGYISFKDDGKIVISKFLNNYNKLGISEKTTIQTKPGNIKYLEYHRNEILKK